MASKKKKRIINSFKYLFLIMGSFVMIVPFIWMISTSFKGTSEIFTFPPIWIPKEPTLRGYVRLLTNNRMPFLAFFKNSFIITLIVVITQVFTSACAGYAFAKLKFKGRKIIFYWVPCHNDDSRSCNPGSHIYGYETIGADRYTCSIDFT